MLGTDQAFFQPPTGTQLAYPCIVYDLDRTDVIFADDRPYRLTSRWQLTLITKKAIEPVFSKIIHLPTCTHTRTFRADQLYHHLFNLNF